MPDSDRPTDRPTDQGNDEHPAAEPAEETIPDPRVGSALNRLADIDDLPVDDHVAVYDQVHRDLREALAEAGSAPETTSSSGVDDPRSGRG